ncbi:MAG: hypothetical protein ACHQT9_00310 [Candidatus Saccharimonadales bacterium]
MPINAATIFDPAKTFDENVDKGPFAPAEPFAGFVNQGEPAYTFLGYKLYSPFGIGAGSLPSSKHIKYSFEHGFDVVCYKTQRSVEFTVNEFPNIVYLDVEGDLTIDKARNPQIGHLSSSKPIEELTITNSFGNPSRGPEFWVEDMKKAVSYRGKGQILIASVVGTIQPGFTSEQYYEDFAVTAELAASTGVQAIEINLSCPNVANEGVICYTYDAVIDICKRVKERVGDIPLIAKIGYFTKEQQELLEKIIVDSSPYIAAYSAINTIQAPVVDEEGNQLLPGDGRLKAGVCGAGIKWAGLDMVKRLVALREKHALKYEIIGIGGVASVEDFNKYREAGADVVQCVTAAMWNDQLGIEIKKSLL